ncbi:MAG: hypothetical protein P0Y62_06490 [Candidatus Chryseobacterium colombiense]|nr:hypothetical protein [Chryseobacterium sp.]WEK71202.1 MAG: hypothetical protein P0Y62_06490 [Chryseobacterium sp.]
MKSIYVIVSLFLTSLFTTAYGQAISKTLINDNLDQLFINKDNPFGDIPAKTVDKYFAETSSIYYFEIVYNGKVIYRESIRKSIPQSRDSETVANQFRFKYSNIYLDASVINESDQQKLLQSRKNEIKEIAKKKFISLNDYQILKKDHSSNKYVILNPLETMKINIYKIDFQ